MKSRVLSILALLSAVLLFCCNTTHALVPHKLNYQGFITSPSGAPLNGSLTMTFNIYIAATGGSALHSEPQTVTVSNGVFNVVLGTSPALVLDFDIPYFLGVTVAADPEMVPRQPLVASPYAIRAASAESLAPSATVAATQITGTLNTAQIANASVTAAKLASNGCGIGQVLQYNGSAWVCATTGSGSGTVTSVTAGTGLTGGTIIGVGTIAVANLGIGTAQLADSAVTAAKLASNGCSNGQILKFFAGVWSCAADGTGAATAGAVGEVLTGSGAAPLFSGSPSLSGNLTLANPSTATTGSIMKGSNTFIHNFGSNNTFVGESAGNLTVTGSGNTAIGSGAGSSLAAGSQNIHIGNVGVAADSTTTRIGSGQTRTFVAGIRGVTPAVNDALPVVIDSNGQLGTAAAVAAGGFTPWQVSATAQLAVANTAYIVTGASHATITLPASPAVGDGVKVSSPGAGGFTIAPNAGQSVIAATIIADVWTPHESARNWISISSSADGSKLAAVVFGGQIYTSTDSGVSWIARDSSRNWRSITSSANGSKLAAVGDGTQIYTSTDSGLTWTARYVSTNWTSITSSADGSKLAAVIAFNSIATSTDSGLNWTGSGFSAQWQSITSSPDGSKLAAVVYGGQIYTSTNSGLSWKAREVTRNWTSITSSADGSKLVAVGEFTPIETSTDSGVSWIARDSLRNWYSIASSADGSKLAAVEFGGQIYTTAITTVSGASLATAELVYAGGGVWSVVLQQGTLVSP